MLLKFHLCVYVAGLLDAQFVVFAVNLFFTAYVSFKKSFKSARMCNNLRCNTYIFDLR